MAGIRRGYGILPGYVAVKIMVPVGYPKYYVPYYNRDPKRDHNFDNHPNIVFSPTTFLLRLVGIGGNAFKGWISPFPFSTDHGQALAKLSHDWGLTR